MHFDSTIIYLLGYPGTGKYTIGKEICRLNSRFRLVDNHLVNNPIFSIIHADGVTPLPVKVWESVGKIWDAVLDTLVHVSPPDFNFVLTNALFDSEGDKAWFEEIQNMAAARNAKFVPVVLRISVEEHQKRIGQPDRKNRMKEIDPKSPQRYALLDNLFIPDHPNLLTLDVSDIPAKESAQIILNYLNQAGE
jgi:hypothetical protein